MFGLFCEVGAFCYTGQSHQVLTFPSSKASFSLTNAEPTASVSLEAAVTGGQISQLNTQVQNSYGAENSDNFSSKERPTSHSPRNVSQLCSHHKFISTDGNWQDLTNHKDMPDHKGVWQGCLFREEGWLFLFRKWVDNVFRHFSRLIHKILWHPRDPNRRCPNKEKDDSSWEGLQKNLVNDIPPLGFVKER